MTDCIKSRGILRKAALGLSLAVFLSGCATLDHNIAMTEQKVLPIKAGETATVPAPAIARAMLNAGFSVEEVREYGHALHIALATTGGAQIRNGKLVQAVFAVHSDRLYVVSRGSGTFIQPLGQAGGRIASR